MTRQPGPRAIAVLSTIAKPIRDNLAMLANLKAIYGTPADVEASLYRPGYFNEEAEAPPGNTGTNEAPPGNTGAINYVCYPGEEDELFRNRQTN
ncbi:hypothetical protein N7468_007312 [Penicillium chermesinum]|uniref:Uncharacterized protein n=1 Tax=Penicillium chermesinum TaxID=63820 RepID=A0A9W9NTX7_9EURO|nr:uncharacterized protein N7468_007312 [Penicillium chermesinum]KAJ5226087.1 hypothetical protein N7468_007312 [Penicillium chermesinum]